MACGMALGERVLAARFNDADHQIVDNHTFVIASDGDMQEGVQAEAASLAGHLGLGRLIAFYDDNKIQLASPVDEVMTEDVGKRYEAYGWHVIRSGEDMDPDHLERVTREAMDVEDRPSLVIVQSHIGFGSPKQDSTKAHGSPLGEEAVRETKEKYGGDPDKDFYVPDEACSLVPGEDRLAVTVEMEGNGAEVRRARFFRSVIRSDARLDYDRVDR